MIATLPHLSVLRFLEFLLESEPDLCGHKNSSSSKMETYITFDHLCEICERLFSDQTYEYMMSNRTIPYTSNPLESNFEVLLRSAEEGCHLCNIILLSIKQYNPQFSNFPDINATVSKHFEYNLNSGEYIIYSESERGHWAGKYQFHQL